MSAAENRIRLIRWIVFIISLVMMGIGIARGEALVVLTKATSICTQCIGIG